MQAIGNHIIVAPTEEEVLASGLIVTMASTRPMHGIVLNVGHRVKDVVPGVKVYFSDIVYTAKKDGKDVYVVAEDKVFAVATE